jgi:hypothetical protein
MPSLQADIKDISGRGEQTRQENPSLDTPENLVRTVKKTPIDTLLQDFDEVKHHFEEIKP